jgi:TRAP-type mannitol/chloroaromatic compound transport system substrate-binding protein
MQELVNDFGVIAQPLPNPIVEAMRAETMKVLNEASSKDALTKKVHDSYFAFKAKYDVWASYSEGTYHNTVRQPQA